MSVLSISFMVEMTEKYLPKSLKENSIFQRVAVKSILYYQRYLSPYKGFSCAHSFFYGGSSCSHYGKSAISNYGTSVGLGLLQTRLHQCREAKLLMIGTNDIPIVNNNGDIIEDGIRVAADVVKLVVDEKRLIDDCD